MNQEKIRYCDILNLGFKETFHTDDVYFKKHGYQWSIVQLKLTNKIYLNWEKDTQLVELIRLDNKKDANIMKRVKIKNLEQVEMIIDFYTDGDSKFCDVPDDLPFVNAA